MSTNSSTNPRRTLSLAACLGLGGLIGVVLSSTLTTSFSQAPAKKPSVEHKLINWPSLAYSGWVDEKTGQPKEGTPTYPDQLAAIGTALDKLSADGWQFTTTITEPKMGTVFLFERRNQ
jgi:hypothetical protein